MKSSTFRWAVGFIVLLNLSMLGIITGSAFIGILAFGWLFGICYLCIKRRRRSSPSSIVLAPSPLSTVSTTYAPPRQPRLVIPVAVARAIGYLPAFAVVIAFGLGICFWKGIMLTVLYEQGWLAFVGAMMVSFTIILIFSLIVARRAAAKRVQERLAEGGDWRLPVPPAALVDVVMPADKKPGSYQNNLIVALGVIIVGLVIVISRSPSDPSAGYQGRDGAQIWVDSSSPDNIYDIVVTGDIGPGDKKFLKVTENIPFGLANVVLNSRGGDVSAGINIGMTIKNNDWGTAVLSGGECDSSCGLIWLAGSPRALHYRAKIGFHAVYYARSGAVSPDWNAVVGAYMERLGFGFDAIRYVTQTPPDQIEWLTAEKAKRYDIAVRFFGK